MQNNIIGSDINTNYSNNTNYSIFTATKSTVTCIQSQTDSYDTKKCDLWPRKWQLIPLSVDVDLEQVLFDFDMSCVECAFNGSNVFVTPWFFLTLITGCNFISSLSLQSAKTKHRVKNTTSVNGELLFMMHMTMQSDIKNFNLLFQC